jgi:hypothetical protein
MSRLVPRVPAVPRHGGEHAGEKPLTASQPPGDTSRTSSAASSTTAARPTFPTTTSNGPSISPSALDVASTL